MYSLAVPLTAPPSAICHDWYSPFSGSSMSIQNWMNTFQGQRVGPKPMVLPLGYRGIREKEMNTVLEDVTLGPTSTMEASVSMSDAPNELDMSTTSSVQTPVPIARVIAEDFGDDDLGLEDEELAYFDDDDDI